MLRVLLVVFAFLVACLIAGATQVGFVITPLELSGLSGQALADRFSTFGLLSLASGIQTAIFSAPLALLAIAVAEWRRVHAWTYYVLVAMVIAGAGFVAQYVSEQQGQPTIVNNYAFTAFMVSGFLAGLAYWLIAGRRTDALERARIEVDTSEPPSRIEVDTKSKRDAPAAPASPSKA